MSVVVVDDSPTNHVMIRSLLERLGITDIRAHAAPEDALVELREARPELIIIDYIMPGIDGVSFIRQLRALPHLPHTPIIMVTTADRRDVRLEALEAGATDFITRPIEPIEFKVRVRNLYALGQA